MGWHNKTTLESRALIGSEIGEAFGECLGKPLSDEFVDVLPSLKEGDSHGWKATSGLGQA